LRASCRQVHTLFRSLGLRHLVIVNSDNTVDGIMTRKELLPTFNNDLN
jgi:predicted transcriptional regulator